MAARRMGLSLFYALAAGVAGTGALICIIAAGWLALLPAIGPVWTPLVIGAILAGIAGISTLALCRRPRGRGGFEGSDEGQDLAAILSAVFQDHKTGLLLGAALAGMLASSDLGRFRR